MIATFDAILGLLDEASQTTKRIEKKEILSRTLSWEEHDQGLLVWVFRYALSPSITFGVKDVKDIEPVKEKIESPLDTFVETLTGLQNRTYTGNEALEKIAVAIGSLPPSMAEIFKRIINGDLKAGIGAKTFNEVYPKAIYIHPYMRCSLLNKKTFTGIKTPFYSQTKLDGMYVDIRVENNKVTYLSREGSVLPFNSPRRDNLLITYANGYTLQGEALVLNEEANGWIDRSKNNGYLNSDNVDVDRVVFVCWDVIPNADHLQGNHTVPYEMRLGSLNRMIYHITQMEGKFLLLVDTQECHTIDDAIMHFKHNRSKGMEGTVIKNKGMIWKDGTSKDQLKLKVSAVGDVKIIGYNMGEGKWEGMVGSLVCASECGKVQVSVNCKTDSFRKKATENIDKWIEDGKIVSVIFNDIVEDQNVEGMKSLYLPRMESDDIRSDKSEADTLERLEDILNNFEFLVE